MTSAVKFALRGIAYGIGLFGLLRLTWTEAHLLLPFTRAQGAMATTVFGPSALPVEVTLACSGGDALAMCLGAVLAYPARWQARLAGATGGIVLIVLLNTARIGTLGQAVASPAWFNALHLYIWPAILSIAIVGYVFAWMHLADRRRHAEIDVAAGTGPSSAQPAPARRFVILAIGFMVLFLAASPLYLESAAVLAVAAFIAQSAAFTLGSVGVAAHAASNVLWTGRGGFLVTQECISTPLLPIYLAAVCAHARSWRWLALGVAAALPLFVLLGILRLLVVALPGALVAAPLFFVHAFYQLLLAAVVVCAAAAWRRGGQAAPRYALAGIAAGTALVYLVGPLYTQLLTSWITLPVDDPQDAIALLPAFQLGLYLAVWIAAFTTFGWKRFAAGLGLLALAHTVTLLLLHGLAGLSPLSVHVRDIRAWAVVGPLLIVAAVVKLAPARR